MLVECFGLLVFYARPRLCEWWQMEKERYQGCKSSVVYCRRRARTYSFYIAT